MAVAWYGVKVWMLVSPDGTDRVIGTRPTHFFVWEMWTVDKRDGTTATIPQRMRPKYQGKITGFSLAYDKEYIEGDDTTIPSVALLRVEYPDGEPAPIDAEDYTIAITTEAKWNTAMNTYPTLKNRFVDQPYYPAAG